MTGLRERLAAGRGVVVQGLGGQVARRQLDAMLAQGTNIVAGVSSREAGSNVQGTPLYANMRDARRATGADAALLIVPAEHVRAVGLAAIAAGMLLVVVLAENVPVMDALALREAADGALLIGPNSPGIVVPGLAKLGFMPTDRVRPGSVGLVSRSGTLSYEVSLQLAELGCGISSWVGIGGDMVPLLDMPSAAELVVRDPHTEVLVVVGEAGGTGEERLAAAVKAGFVSVPVHALLVGKHASDSEPLGHAGAVILGDAGGYESKAARLRDAGITVHNSPWALASAVAAATTTAEQPGPLKTPAEEHYG